MSLGPGWERFCFCTSGGSNGCCRVSFRVLALTGALGGDDVPACATNSFEQDDFAELILILPGGRLDARENILHG